MVLTSPFEKPVPIAAHHDLSGFDCGIAVLDEWLRQRAAKNAESGASRSYVCCPRDSAVVAGYYTLCAGQIARVDAPGKLRRNMPDSIPGILLGRLAVDRRSQGFGLAKAMLQDAAFRSLRVAEQIGARILFVHAIDDKAATFYRHFGFAPLPVSTRTLALDLTEFSTA